MGSAQATLCDTGRGRMRVGLRAVVEMAVEFRLLGDLEVRIGGQLVEVGHVRQRCVLVALLLEANRVVPVDQLVDRVWGDRAPQRARGTLYSYLSRLRQVLATTDDAVIARQPCGYVLTVDPQAVDVHRFERLVGQARAAADQDAAPLLAEALALWRGAAFATLDTPWLNAARDGLDRARRAVELDRNDLALRSGRHAEVLGELSAWTAAHPLDERLAGQLMLALYRAGRQGDALACYRQMRLRLAEELGTDPSPPLNDLHQQVLTADPALAATAPTIWSAVARSPVPRQLPAPPRAFTGRSGELAALSAALDGCTGHGGGTVMISAVGGTGGIGKTWLALRWAHDNLRLFPDGQLYVNLRGFDLAIEPVPSAVAVRGFLDALGVGSAAIPPDPDAQAALYRSLVAGRRMLIVLDNARDSAQVAPLLPGTATAGVLVTSRRQLTGLITEHGARPLALDVLTEAEARHLLTGHLGAGRTGAESDAVAALLRHCAGLPLALGIVAARAAVRPDLPLAALAAELREAATRLDALDGGELAINLRAVLSGSSRALPPDAAQMFGLLGLAPGPDIDLHAAASLAALAPARTRILMRQLTAAHLVQEPVPGRYRMHDLVRLFAAEQAAAHSAGEQRAALQRLLDHYLHTAYAADRLLAPHRDRIAPALPPSGTTPKHLAGHGDALAWFTAEHAVLLAAADCAAGAGFDTHVWQLAWALTTFFDWRGHWHDRAVTYTAALDAAQRMADRSEQARAHCGVAVSYTWLGRYEDARSHLAHALGLFGELGDVDGQAHAQRCLARVYARQGGHRQALPHDEQAYGLYQAAGDDRGQATALNAIGWHHAHLGEHQRALAYCQQALAFFHQIGDRSGAAATWDSLGYIHHHLGHYRKATTCYQRALELLADRGNRYQQAVTLVSLGDVHCAAGDTDGARGAWRHALTILAELGHPDAHGVRARLHGEDRAAEVAA
jgi:DNA-binding SARP family transcriptional activator/tetratricopeptide (TPR) repeat protein